MLNSLSLDIYPLSQVCDIIEKLLAKTAEDRYQSAQGLVADLQHCLNHLCMEGYQHITPERGNLSATHL